MWIDAVQGYIMDTNTRVNKGKHSRALGYGNGWRNFVSMVVPAQARSLTSQVIPMRVIVTAERLQTFWTGEAIKTGELVSTYPAAK